VVVKPLKAAVLHSCRGGGTVTGLNGSKSTNASFENEPTYHRNVHLLEVQRGISGYSKTAPGEDEWQLRL
jgi:hypothetical protein